MQGQATIHEIAEIDVTPGTESDFEAAVAAAAPAFRAATGCHGLRLVRSVEHPSRFRLVVTWETVEHHTELFRQSDGFKKWRELAGPFFASPPRVEHVVTRMDFDWVKAG